MNYYRRFMGDYLRDTMHLSLAEDGAYGRLLDLYYSTEKPLTLDAEKLYSAARGYTEDSRKIIDKILHEFFRKTKRGWVNKKAETEIKLNKSRVYAARENGKKGGKPVTHRKPTGLAQNAILPNPEQSYPAPAPAPAPTTTNSNTKSKAFARSNFELFWDAYPRKVAKPSAMRAWAKVPGAEDNVLTIIEGIDRWKKTDQWREAQYIPSPATFLSRRQWQDEVLE